MSGFHDHRHRQANPRQDPDAAIWPDLRIIHAGSRRIYGRLGMVRALRACAHAVGHQRAPRLMHEEGSGNRAKGRFKPRTTDSRHIRTLILIR